MEYATIEAFRSDPEKVWRFYAPRIAMLVEAEPNAAHHALAELERLGLVRAIVTQNIDLLHARAGSRDVIEVHGSIRTSTCPHCGASHGLERVQAMLAERPDEAPRCASCAAVLKPDVVFFGESVPREVVATAQHRLEQADAMLIVGSSLMVYSGFRFVQMAARRQIPIAAVNLGRTRADDLLSLKVEDRCEAALAFLL